MMSERGSLSNDGFLERRTKQEKCEIKVTAGSCIHCAGAIYVEKALALGANWPSLDGERGSASRGCCMAS
jgi:hypothetical protein